MPFPPEDIYEEFSKALVGLSCVAVEHPSDWFWEIRFGKNGKSSIGFGIETNWRVLLSGGILFGSGDHGQSFGLPNPVDVPRYCRQALGSSCITSATLCRGTSDAILRFENGAQLEIFNSSGSHEGWGCVFGAIQIIAKGGGELAIMEAASHVASQERSTQE